MLVIATECTVGLECRRGRRCRNEKQRQRDSGRRTTVHMTHGDAGHSQQRKESLCFHRSVTLGEAQDGGLPATYSSHVCPTHFARLALGLRLVPVLDRRGPTRVIAPNECVLAPLEASGERN
jgi:hypothetical protein